MQLLFYFVRFISPLHRNHRTTIVFYLPEVASAAFVVDYCSSFIFSVQAIVTFEQACLQQIISASRLPCYFAAVITVVVTITTELAAAPIHTFAFLSLLSFLSAVVLSIVWPLQFPVSQPSLYLAKPIEPVVSTSGPIV